MNPFLCTHTKGTLRDFTATPTQEHVEEDNQSELSELDQHDELNRQGKKTGLYHTNRIRKNQIEQESFNVSLSD